MKKKYYVTFNITLPYEVEIDAENYNDAKSRVQLMMMNQADIIQEFAEAASTMDMSSASVEVNTVTNQDGQYLYDGIGIF